MNTSEYFNIFNNEETYFYYTGTQKLILNTIKRYLPGKAVYKILDAGCGTGLLAKKMTTLGQVIGVDTSDIALKLAKKRGIKVIKANVTKLPFPNNSFDLITSIDVLYHQNVQNDKIACIEFFRVLKPNGILIIKLPAHNWLSGKHDKEVHTRHRYSKKELNTLLNKTGFKVLKLSYIASFLLPLAIISRITEKITDQPASSDLKPLNKFLNEIFAKMYSLEEFLLRHVNIPFGLSVYAVASKIKIKEQDIQIGCV